jgi:acyl dehydratase
MTETHERMERPKYWDDFVAGARYRTAARTITEADLIMWSGLTGDYHALQTDVEYAKRTEFGSRIAHGPLTFSYAAGLVVRSGILDDSLVAWLGVNSMKIPRVVKLGDTIRVDIEVLESRPSRQPERGVTVLRYHVINQHDEEVMTCDMAFLTHGRSSTGDS